MRSTPSDGAGWRIAPVRIALRSVTLISMVVFMGLTLTGLTGQEEEFSAPDGTVHIAYPASIRDGAQVDIRVALEPRTCDLLVIGLEHSYLELINDLDLTPDPDSQEQGRTGVSWRFTGENPEEVHIMGRAGAAWGRPARGVLAVECGGAYEVDLLTARLP